MPKEPALAPDGSPKGSEVLKQDSGAASTGVRGDPATRPDTRDDAGADSGLSQERRQSPKPRRLAEHLALWVPMATAVAALALSFFTWFQSQRTPEITLNLPSIVRIGSIDDGTFDVFLQPSFSVPRAYDSLARISAVQLEFVRHGAPAAEEAEFSWQHSGHFGEFEDGGFGWTYEADPGPFIVGPEEPQRPMIRFTTEEQQISPGRWMGTITAYREAGQEPLIQRFCVLVSQEDMLDYSEQMSIIDFRNDIADSSTDCYWRPDHWS